LLLPPDKACLQGFCHDVRGKIANSASVLTFSSPAFALIFTAITAYLPHLAISDFE